MKEQDLRRANRCSWADKSETVMRHKEDDIRDCLRASDPVDVVWPLSSAVLRLLEETSEIADPLPSCLSQRLLGVLRTSEVLWESPLPNNMMVFKCPADVVVKAVRHVDDDTEYTTLQYLELHSPAIPAPRPLGYVRMSGITLIFQTYKPSTTPCDSVASTGQRPKRFYQRPAGCDHVRSKVHTLYCWLRTWGCGRRRLQRHQKTSAAE